MSTNQPFHENFTIFLLNKMDIQDVPKKWMFVIFMFAIKLHFLGENIAFWLNSFFQNLENSILKKNLVKSQNFARENGFSCKHRNHKNPLFLVHPV